ncbi:MAG: InlB B-repeat-containing protein [Prevotella sp.]|nr:InlB B-repeat-containing protein [Prevotella sp.]
MNNIIHTIRHTAWAATVLLLALLTAQTAAAQDLGSLLVYTEVPTVTSGQSSNWNADMENGENYNKLVDGNTGTKYGLDIAEPWVEFYYDQPIRPNGYALWTANDTEGQRNPKSWTIKAKNVGDSDWTTLVSVDNSSNDKLPMANNTETRFALQNSTAYKYFRFEATRNADTGQFQLAELQFLYTDEPTKLQFAGISGISSRYAYTGEAIPVTFSVAAADGTALTFGTHYTATLGGIPLESNTFGVINEGSYTVTITAKDGSGYSGSTSKTFSVVGMKAINLPSVEHGTVTATVNGEAVTQAAPGDEVTLTIAWDEGYELEEESFSVKDGNDATVVEFWNGRGYDDRLVFTFTMPASAVTVSATIRKETFYINWMNDYGEMFRIEPSPNRASEGETVTLTVTKANCVVMSDLKVWYYNKSGGNVYNAPRRRGGGSDEFESMKKYLNLTKVSETEYTFTMPAASVEIGCNVSYVGQYALNRAEGIPAEAIRFEIGDGIEATAANEGDRVRLSFKGAQVSNLSVTGVSTGNAVALDGDYFTMPAEAVTVSAEFKYQLYYRNEWHFPLTAKAGNVDIAVGGGEESYVAPGTVVTLTAKSAYDYRILSYLQVSGDTGGQIPITDIVETSEDGFPHVYTTTFVMPYGSVTVFGSFGNPITVTFDANGGEGTMEAITIGAGGIIFLPECTFTREGYTFAGWKLPMYEEIQPAGREVGLSDENVTCIAQWTKNELTLADASDNNAAIGAAADDGKQYAVTLSGRTLYKDGSWNTLCLPFEVTIAGSPLDGDNVQAMTLNTTMSNLADGTLTLNFDAATTIPAGTPFIIKWNNTGVNIENPVFEGVTVSNATNDATVEGVLTFTGTYAPVTIADGGDNTKLYLGNGNKLYYPNAAMTIGCQRAYFQLAPGEPASPVRAFVLNFGDEYTGIKNGQWSMDNGQSETWLTIDGCKLDGKPTQRGIYINNGKKVVIK